MIKKISLIFLFLLFLADLRWHSLWAQKEQTASPKAQQLEYRELDKKLDRILDNQDKILAELAIIKVRASR